MTESTPPYYLTIAELRRAFSEQQLSPVEIIEEYIRRIESLDDRLHSYTTVMADDALKAAKRAEQRFIKGEAIGLLDGIAIGLKDVFDTRGVRTTANSSLYRNRIPETDATVVKRLKQNGAIILGKLSLHEFASGVHDENSSFPAARNPWNTDHSPGGSSSGSAVAVAAGLCAGAFGSDTTGSIRAPASYCGIVGLKPSSGLVSRYGVIPLSWSLDHVGPMTRSVEDAAILLQAVAGYDPLDLGSTRTDVPSYLTNLKDGIRGLRIGAPLEFLNNKMNIHADTMRTFQEALAILRDLGADVVETGFPEIFEYATELALIISTSETFAYHEQFVQEQPGKYGKSFINVPLQGALYSASDYIQALRGRTVICQEMIKFMDSFDLLALPSKSSPALRITDEATPTHWTNTTLLRRLFSMTGQPAISIPAGFSQDMLPVGIQLVGRLYEEKLLLTAAYAYEEATQWHLAHPPL